MTIGKDEETVAIRDDLYRKADVEKLDDWLEMVAALFIYDPSAYEELKSATRALGAKAQAQYAGLETGEANATLDVCDASPFLDRFPKKLHLWIVLTTGELLWSCADGPNAGAVVLCEYLDKMHNSYEEAQS